MDPWNCCRMCLGSQLLHPIFIMLDYHEKYTEMLLYTTGIKVELNDNLPQQICTPCIKTINNSYKFRKKSENNQNILIKLFTDKSYDVKTEIFDEIKLENDISINISDYITDIQYNDNDNNDYNYDNDIDIDTKTENPHINDKVIEIIPNGKKKKIEVKPVKRSLRSDNRSGEEKERVKEEIECKYCHKILTSKLSLRNHYKIHTGFDVVCEHCGKKFITRRLLLMHCRAKHGYEKTDRCSFCDYTASNAEQVKIHERLHTGEKPFVCSECGAGFHRKSSYLQHIAIHLPDKTVQCDQCPARFKSVTLMKIHKNRHKASAYTFKCKVCENNFARRRNVARHLQRIHGVQPHPDMIERLKIAK